MNPIITTCRICGDLARGLNYNEFTCESCKVFFHRNWSKAQKLKCRKNDGNCQIEKSNRKACAKCRLNKCYSLGMFRKAKAKDCFGESHIKPHKVINKVESKINGSAVKTLDKIVQDSINDHTIEPEESLLPENKESSVSVIKRNLDSLHLTPYEWSIIHEIQNAMTVFSDENKAQIIKVANEVSDALHVPEIYFKWVAQFCRKISAFNQMKQDDQLVLMKYFCFDGLVIRMAFNTDPVKFGYPMIVDDSGNEAFFIDFKLFNNIKQEFVQPYIQFWLSLHEELENDVIIKDLLTAQVLFKPENKVSCPEFVRYHYLAYATLLRKYLECKYRNESQARKKFSALMAQFDEIQRVKEFEVVMFNKELEFTRIPHIVVEMYNLI